MKKYLILFVAITAVFYGYYKYSIYSPVEKYNTDPVSFVIKQGETAKDIGKKLENLDLIRSELTFYHFVKTNDFGQDIRSGRFTLAKGMNVPEIIETITNTSNGEAVLTIQEGLTTVEIDKKLADQGLIQEGELLSAIKNFNDFGSYPFIDKNNTKQLIHPLEGFIYPDTYFLDPMDFAPNDLIYKSLENFKNKWNEADRNNSRIIKKYSTAEIITMASIIEKEVFGYEDRKRVAGILWKRLENGWTIGADATLLYLKNDRTITKKDLQEDSPYNTRKNQGLPPGPIANPSLESINAALNPTDTPYWFYLNTPDTGEVIYAETNEQHNLNREKYL